MCVCVCVCGGGDRIWDLNTHENQIKENTLSELRSCVKVEVAVLGSRPNKPTVSVDVKQHSANTVSLAAVN